jgi:hypothetical protein
MNKLNNKSKIIFYKEAVRAYSLIIIDIFDIKNTVVMNFDCPEFDNIPIRNIC